MIITKRQLQKIIKEELQNILEKRFVPGRKRSKAKKKGKKRGYKASLYVNKILSTSGPNRLEVLKKIKARWDKLKPDWQKKIASHWALRKAAIMDPVLKKYLNYWAELVQEREAEAAEVAAPLETGGTEETPTDTDEKPAEPLTLKDLTLFFKEIMKMEQSDSPEDVLAHVQEQGNLLSKRLSKTNYMEQKELLKEYEKQLQDLKNIHQAVADDKTKETFEKVEQALENAGGQLKRTNISTMKQNLKAKVRDVSTKTWTGSKYEKKPEPEYKAAKQARAALTTR